VGIVLGFFFIHVSKHCMRTVIEKKTYAAWDDRWEKRTFSSTLLIINIQVSWAIGGTSSGFLVLGSLLKILVSKGEVVVAWTRAEGYALMLSPYFRTREQLVG
jgi:hypothetical protein